MINILSLFDGLSGGRLALDKQGIAYDNYYASEVDKYAIAVANKNYPTTIQLGDVTKINAKDLPDIYLLIGGSPCQGFSRAGYGKGFKDDRSKLLLEYIRLKNELKPKYFLLENVAMSAEDESIITKLMGVNPITINSALLSAQNRVRLYWTNIGLAPAGLFNFLESSISQPKDKGLILKDILEDDVDPKYYLSDKSRENIYKGLQRSLDTDSGYRIMFTDTIGKATAIDANYGKGYDGKRTVIQIKPSKESGNLQPYQKNIINDINGINPALSTLFNGADIIGTDPIRRLTPIEVERLQTVPDNYTAGVSDTQRYKMLGNGFTIDVIAYILSYL